MSDSVDRVFVHALNTVKRIPRTGTARPPAAERLKLYGLYKQSMEGDVEGVMDRPIGNTPEVHAECEKWDAWYAQRGLTRTEAKRRYISTLIDTMHEYASQTPEARELVGELEFVWDQIKYNTSSSSSSGPLNAVGVPPLSRHTGSAYGSIGGRLAGSVEDYERPNMRGDDRNSRLRVLSPVSQPEEEEYYHRSPGNLDQDDDLDDDDDDDDEEYEEARDSLYEDQEHDHETADTASATDHTSHADDRRHTQTHSHKSISGASSNNSRARASDPHNLRNSPWRRRVEQALTKMTAEIAAVREQMEARTLATRRRNGVLAWLRWILWTVLRQVLWDLAMLGALLIFMRLKGDRRVENRLRSGWSDLKAKLGQIKLLRRAGDMPVLP
ncbi:hypothetical protein N7490_010110 [Penicillium lividum]|nr:hypothetical protein N7490_010110 [Penicillium lividum]